MCILPVTCVLSNPCCAHVPCSFVLWTGKVLDVVGVWFSGVSAHIVHAKLVSTAVRALAAYVLISNIGGCNANVASFCPPASGTQADQTVETSMFGPFTKAIKVCLPH